MEEVTGSRGQKIIHHLEAKPLQVEQTGEGKIQMRVQTPAGEQTLIGTHLLVATGRVPNTDGLSLEASGVEIDSWGYIKTNERLETRVPGIYALGGCQRRACFYPHLLG